MGQKRPKGQPAGRASLHLTADAEVVSRFCAFAGHHRRSYGDVFAEAVKLVTRGFSVHVRTGLPADEPGRTAATAGEGSDAA